MFDLALIFYYDPQDVTHRVWNSGNRDKLYMSTASLIPHLIKYQ
jgi:hypothetical protein